MYGKIYALRMTNPREGSLIASSLAAAAIPLSCFLPSGRIKEAFLRKRNK